MVLGRLDGSRFGLWYAWFCFLVLCLWFPCCVCALISLPLALVVRTYLRSVVFLLCLGSCWAGRARLGNGLVYGVLL